MNTPTVVNPSAITAKLNKLNEIDAERKKLSEEIETERQQALAALPASFGFTDSAEFVRSLAAVHNVRGFSPLERRASGRRVTQARSTGRKARTTLTPDARKQIVADFKSGKEKEWIMKHYDISAPTAQIYKKQSGMVREHKK